MDSASSLSAGWGPFLLALRLRAADAGVRLELMGANLGLTLVALVANRTTMRVLKQKTHLHANIRSKHE